MKRKHLKQTAPACLAGTAILALTILTGCGANETVTQSAQKETELAAEPEEHAELQNDEPKAESADSAADSSSSREDELQTAVIRHHYADVLSQLCFEWKLPDIEIEDPNSGGRDWYQMSDNTYTVTDIDGDGILYAIQTDLSGSDLWGVDAYQFNQADYQMWYDEHLGGANEISVDCQPIEGDRFCVYTEDYLALLAAIRKETHGGIRGATDNRGIRFRSRRGLLWLRHIFTRLPNLCHRLRTWQPETVLSG